MNALIWMALMWVALMWVALMWVALMWVALMWVAESPWPLRYSPFVGVSATGAACAGASPGLRRACPPRSQSSLSIRPGAIPEFAPGAHWNPSTIDVG